MTRRGASLLVLCILIGSPSQAAAQDARRLTVAAGVTSLREQPPGDLPATTYAAGWAVTGSYTFLWDRLGVTAEVGASAATNLVDERQTLKFYLFGAHYDLMRTMRLRTFAQVLVGREEFSEPGFSERGVAIQPGGGVDVVLWKRVGARAQVDYRMTRYDQATFRDWRLLVGGVADFDW